ncbi:MAG TPA: hypothetical protein VMV86_00695 [Methanosarcinales archaeon]|nr:hypothetical protein [Methanosarcinales archaeon]
MSEKNPTTTEALQALHNLDGDPVDWIGVSVYIKQSEQRIKELENDYIGCDDIREGYAKNIKHQGDVIQRYEKRIKELEKQINNYEYLKLARKVSHKSYGE